MTEAVKRKRAALGLSATVYTPDDLAANEDGHLSEAQIAQLQALAKVRRRSVRGEFISAGIIVSLLLSFCRFLTVQPTNFTDVLVSGSLILGVVVGAAWLASEIKMDTVFSIIYDAERGTVKADRGHVQTSVVRAPMSSLDNKMPPEMRYYLHINSKTLETDYATHLTIRPDEEYTVYYTPSSYIAVLVKPASELPMLAQVDRQLVSRTGSRAAVEEYVRYLHAAFDTTPEVLRLNSAGELSSGQIANLQRMVGNQTGLGILMVVVLVVIGVICALAINNSPNPNASDLWLMFIGVVVLVMIYQARSIWKFRALWLDARDRQVESIDGRAVTRPSRKNPGEYDLVIGGIEFTVYKAQYDLLQHGDPYTVYFTPHSRTLLAIEWLGASPFKPEGSTPSPTH
ncbi:MAG: hypothetical protein J0M33_09750 [Anaerolineae bacterium]|nr:hypothetical protein [Anaerolineae bacterium]